MLPRILPCAAALIFGASVLAADQKPLTFELTVSPAGDPGGPVDHPLAPSFRERKPGNAALCYHRAIGHRRSFAKDVTPLEEKFDKALESQPRSLTGPDIEKYVETHRNVYRELHAARLRLHCDWQLDDNINAHGIGVLLEEIQQCRALAVALKYRIRWLLGQGKLDEALLDIQAGLVMGRHVGHGPTVIVRLVGVAIESVFFGELMQVMQMPGSPNLYRALSGMPQPIFTGHAFVEGEQRMMESTLQIQNIANRGVTHDEAIRVLACFADAERDLGQPKAKLTDADRQKADAMVQLMRAKSRAMLTKAGFKDAELKGLTDAQIVVTDLVRRMRSRHDEVMEVLRLPYPEAIARGKLLDEKYPDTSKKLDVVEILNRLLMPAIVKLVGANLRVDRQAAMLRIIEAVRLHAAENKGELPAKLEALAKLVTIPADPASGKPFEYKLDGTSKFILRAPPYDNGPPSQGNCIEYTITLK